MVWGQMESFLRCTKISSEIMKHHQHLGETMQGKSKVNWSRISTESSSSKTSIQNLIILSKIQWNQMLSGISKYGFITSWIGQKHQTLCGTWQHIMLLLFTIYALIQD